jgi:hypothetical protein
LEVSSDHSVSVSRLRLYKGSADPDVDAGLICHGFDLGMAKFFSKHVALQIKAALEGRPFHAYTDSPVPVVDMQ